MSSRRTFYTILGISRRESPAGVRSAFRDLARRYHPDRAGARGTPYFQEIVEAYQTLSDPARRADYDRGLDPTTGEELWRFARDYQVKTTTPLVAEGLIVLSGGYRGKPLFALKTDGRGDISLAEGQSSSENVAWVSEPGGPYTSTPIILDDVIYFVRNTGILTTLDLQTGELIHRQRLGGNFSASPVASDGRLFFPSEEGIVSVVRAAREPEILASNDMGEPCMATPAISDGALFIRTRSRLYAIGNEARSSAGP